MKKSAISILALAAAMATSLPALADTDYTTMAKDTVLLPVRTLALGTGIVLGTPIAVARRIVSRSTEYTQNMADQIGGKDKILSVAGASVLGVPFGIIAGSAEGVYYGGKNAISNCVDHPFSKDSFSLGELE